MANSKSPYSSITGANEADRQNFTLEIQPEDSEDELLFLQLLDPSGQTDFWDDVSKWPRRCRIFIVINYSRLKFF